MTLGANTAIGLMLYRAEAQCLIDRQRRLDYDEIGKLVLDYLAADPEMRATIGPSACRILGQIAASGSGRGGPT